jgi:hypothetical protein
MVAEHVLTCHCETRLNSITLLNMDGRVFKYNLFILSWKMECKSEQRVNIKFLVKVKKFAMETFQLLTGAYSEECMFHACVFEWHK